MTREMMDVLKAQQKQLKELVHSRESARVMFGADDPEGGLLSGNEDGFLLLAVECLEAAQGNSVSFEGSDWLHSSADWLLLGLSYDPHPDAPMPPQPTLASRIFAPMILVAILGVFGAGLLTISKVVIQIIRR